jgi:hypothetical protein
MNEEESPSPSNFGMHRANPMDDFTNDVPDEAARQVLVWRMAQLRAELMFALGWKKTQARNWAQRCHTAGVRFKLPHADTFSTFMH